MKGTIRARVVATLTVMAMGATACGGGGADDVVSLPSVPTGVLAAVNISLGDLGIEPEQVDAGEGVFLVPRSRIVFADATCDGDAEGDGLVVRADGQLLETLQRARLQITVTADDVDPAEGELEILVGDPDQGLTLVSTSPAGIDGRLVSIEGVYEPQTERVPLRERLVGGSFRLVVRCPARG